MNTKALKTLEFDKIIDRLAELAGSEPGRELCRRIEPLSSLSEIEQHQTETADALGRLLKNGRVSFGGITDIRADIKRLEIGSPLNAGELLRLARLLRTVSAVKAYGMQKKEENFAEEVAKQMGN